LAVEIALISFDDNTSDLDVSKLLSQIKMPTGLQAECGITVRHMRATLITTQLGAHPEKGWVNGLSQTKMRSRNSATSYWNAFWGLARN
jgi:hypothetical protein